MHNRITPGQIKQTNRQQIYNYIYQQKKVSQQDIIYALRLSRPTVTVYLTELVQAGLVRKNDRLDSDQFGRKAVTYSIIPDFRIAIGVEVMADKVKMIAVDLYGKMIHRSVVKNIRFTNAPLNDKMLSDFILDFIGTLPMPGDKILGIGIVIQGQVSVDGSTAAHGKILDCTGLKVDAFTTHLPYPCSLIRTPDAAALSELWSSPELANALYLFLSWHLGASLIFNRTILTGKHGCTATLENAEMFPRGEWCYCGNYGCVETVCSMKTLLGDEDPEAFFEGVHTQLPEQLTRWRTYLKNLADLIEMLSMVLDIDFILGGHLTRYFTEADIQFLYDELWRNCPFKHRGDYIRISKMPLHNITIGAALPYIQHFLDDVNIGATKK